MPENQAGCRTPESREERVGQLFMPAAFINDTEEAVRRLEHLIRTFHIGGLCFFHSPASAATNFEGKKEIPYNPDSLGTLKELIRRYQKAARYPLLIAMDAEWGLAMRVENGPAYPYALCLGALDPADPLLYQTGLRMAADCREAGIHWNLAPVADVNSNSANPVIGYRAFGADPETVAAQATGFYRGLRDGGVLGCAKHFPGHGDTARDSHLELPEVEKSRPELEKTEFPPFRRLIEAGVDAVMTGHLSVPALDPEGTPASLSRAVISGTLRGELGYDGPVISDALNMHAVSKVYSAPGEVAWRAFNAGNDMLCFAQDIPRAHARICAEGEARRIDAAFGRIQNLKDRVFGSSPTPVEPAYSPAALRRELATACLTRVAVRGQVPSLPDGGSPALVCAGKDLGVFAHELTGYQGLEQIDWDVLSPRKDAYQYPRSRDVLLALNPPEKKPAGDFGLHPAALEAIGKLVQNHRVRICLFGNPYVLDRIDISGTHGVLVAYVPFEEFQHQAALYFLGRAGAPGKLPIPLKNLKP